MTIPTFYGHCNKYGIFFAFFLSNQWYVFQPVSPLEPHRVERLYPNLLARHVAWLHRKLNMELEIESNINGLQDIRVLVDN